MRIIPEVLIFIKHLEQKGYSVNTVRSYVRDLKSYYGWMKEEGLEAFEVKPKHIPSFIAYIDSKHSSGAVSPSTLNGYLATLGTFYRYFEVVHEGMVQPVSNDTIKKLGVNQNRGFLRHTIKGWDKSVYSFFRRRDKKKKLDRKRIRADIAKQFYLQIEEIWTDNEALKVRNQLIFKVLYETGMRVGELLNLRVSDFDYPDSFDKTGNIYLIDRKEEQDPDRKLKTGERVIPVSTSLLQEIDDYVMYHRPYTEGIEYLFVSHSTSNEGAIPTRKSINKMFKKIFDMSEFKNVIFTPHSMRHTHASNLQDAGLGIDIIKARLGHSSIETTTKYAKPSPETLSIAYERYLINSKGGAF
jgi:integrase/recombinase XerD